MTHLYSLTEIEQALRLPGFDGATAQSKMAPAPRPSQRPRGKTGQSRLGGVLLLLYCRESELSLILTLRRDDLQSHAGQVSFPGGRNEPNESLLQTALRETDEEIGIKASELTVIGELTPLYIFPSDFEVHPFVAWYANGQRPHFQPHAGEVAELIEVPIRHLMEQASRQEEIWSIRGFELKVPFFQVGEHKVWGATAMMLSEFIERLRAISSPTGS